jgi:hypothetical protein
MRRFLFFHQKFEFSRKSSKSSAKKTVVPVNNHLIDRQSLFETETWQPASHAVRQSQAEPFDNARESMNIGCPVQSLDIFIIALQKDILFQMVFFD